MPEKPTYAIKDWDRIFENAASRKVERLGWVAIPNRHDSAGYGRLISLDNGPAIYGAWVVMVQVASKMPKRGILANESGPLDEFDLEARTRIKAKLFRSAIDTLIDVKIGWIYVHSGSVLPVGYQSATSPSGRTGAEGEGRGVDRSEGNLMPEAANAEPARKKPRTEKQIERDALFDAIKATFFPSGTSKADESLIGKTVTALKAKNAIPDEIAKRLARWPLLYPDAGPLTPSGLAKHWDALGIAREKTAPEFNRAAFEEEIKKWG